MSRHALDRPIGPPASTCTRTLCLPAYEDAAALARGIEFSLMDGGFGLA